jgi:phi13 family phage major tail protein
MADNKVKFGLKNVHYALVTETVVTTGADAGKTVSSYGELKALAGAVSLSLSSSASKSVFRADNEDYYVSYGEGGYEGDLEVARVNEGFLKDVLGYVEDDDKILVEAGAAFKTVNYFALVFEFDGDQKATKHCLYKCSASRPNIASQTTGEGGSTDPQTETVTITAVPRIDEDKYIHLQTQDSTSTAVVEAWYSAVPVPTFS